MGSFSSPPDGPLVCQSSVSAEPLGTESTVPVVPEGCQSAPPWPPPRLPASSSGLKAWLPLPKAWSSRRSAAGDQRDQGGANESDAQAVGPCGQTVTRHQAVPRRVCRRGPLATPPSGQVQ